MPVRALCSYLSRRYDVSIVTSEQLDGAVITIDLRGLSLGESLDVVARRLQVEVVQRGSLYFLGELRNEDKAVLIRRVRRLPVSQIQSAVQTVISQEGRVTAATDGLIIVADKVSVLSRVHDFCSQLEDVESVTWVVQLYLTRGVVDRLRDVGVDVLPAAEIGLSLASAAEGRWPTATPTVEVDAAIDAILRAEAIDSQSRGFASPFLILGDGETASLSDGRLFPYRTRSVSDQGTATDSGISTIDVSTTINATCREVSDERARLDLTVTLAEAEGEVDGLPLVRNSKVDFSADVRSGRVYLLGRLETLDESESKRSWFQFGKTSSINARHLEVWGRVYRVATLAKGLRFSDDVVEPESGDGSSAAVGVGVRGGSEKPAIRPIHSAAQVGDSGAGIGAGAVVDPRSGVGADGAKSVRMHSVQDQQFASGYNPSIEPVAAAAIESETGSGGEVHRNQNGDTLEAKRKPGNSGDRR